MAQRGNAADAAELARLSGDVERWRRTRAKLSPMPGPLWRAAIALARRLGVNPVKNALGLNYKALRSRVEAGGEVAAGARAGAPTARFVELSGAQVLGLPGAGGPVVEFIDAHGTRVTVRLAAGTALDVARLVEAFRRPSA
jgi:hypothetical protein